MSNNPERINSSPEKGFDTTEARGEQTEKLRATHEKAVEHLNDTHENLESVRAQAQEAAIETDRVNKERGTEASPATKRTGPITKKQLDVNFKREIAQAQSQMSAPSRAFSKVIHNKAVERTSEVVGSTVARPNAILAGAVAAFILTTAVYIVAKSIGYRLSGFESIAAFVVGWIIGTLFDYFRIMITGKK